MLGLRAQFSVDLLQVCLLVMGREKEKEKKGNRKKEGGKDGLVALVCPVGAAFRFFYSPDNILYGEWDSLSVASIGCTGVAGLSFLLSSVFLFPYLVPVAGG